MVMNSLTIEQLDNLIQTRNPEEQKIKYLLDSPTEENQLLGLQMARSVLGWSFYDIGYYVLNSGKSWKEHFNILTGDIFGYTGFFCGEYIAISFTIFYSIALDLPYLEGRSYKQLFSGSELEKTKAETSEFIRKICEENSIL